MGEWTHIYWDSQEYQRISNAIEIPQNLKESQAGNHLRSYKNVSLEGREGAETSVRWEGTECKKEGKGEQYGNLKNPNFF